MSRIGPWVALSSIPAFPVLFALGSFGRIQPVAYRLGLSGLSVFPPFLSPLVDSVNMMDFQVKRTTRRCHKTDQELKPGQDFYSELVDEQDGPCRRDYCEQAWNGPDEHSIGWWKATIPEIEGGKVYWAPRDILLSYFESLQQHKKNAAAAYVMALLLVRKRIVTFVDSQSGDGGETLEIFYAKEKKTWNIPVQTLAPEQIQEIQTELAQQLFTDHPPEPERLSPDGKESEP